MLNSALTLLNNADSIGLCIELHSHYLRCGIFKPVILLEVALLLLDELLLNLLSTIDSIQLANADMLVYTPGHPSLPHPTPKLTIPAAYHTPSRWTMRGPPESPEQESWACPPAHIWDSTRFIFSDWYFVTHSLKFTFCIATLSLMGLDSATYKTKKLYIIYYYY